MIIKLGTGIPSIDNAPMEETRAAIDAHVATLPPVKYYMGETYILTSSGVYKMKVEQGEVVDWSEFEGFNIRDAQYHRRHRR